MFFQETDLKGAFIIEPKRLEDNRGFFARVYCQREFEENGLNPRFVQCNMSRSLSRGTLRGLHYQVSPQEEDKLVRCIKGAIYDVIVDIRPDSKTYRQWIATELTDENYRMLYVPAGFAHGFQSLVDNTEVLYPASEYYSPESERGIRWNDAIIGIKWPIPDPILSEKDAMIPDYQG